MQGNSRIRYLYLFDPYVSDKNFLDGKIQMTDNVVIVECAYCGEEEEIFEDATEFNCPYCKETCYLVEEGEDPPEENLAPEVRYNNELVLGRSIVESWCSKHKEKTEHGWITSRRFGQRLACLICWPSERPKSPIYHRKKEEA